MPRGGAPKGHPAYNKNGEGGRPKIWTDEEIEKQAEAFWEFLEDPKALLFEEFTLKQKINPAYLPRWAKRNAKFCEVYEYAREWQKLRLKKGSLLKKFDNRTAIFLLSAEYGLSAKQIVEHEGQGAVNIIHYGDGPAKTWKEEQSS